MAMEAVSNSSKKMATRGVAAILCTGVLGALLSAQAGAACMDPDAASAYGGTHQLPMFALHPSAVQNFAAPADAAKKIVGTWQVAYASGGVVYGEAFIQWHSDGTEWENVDFPILGGNLCMGSWKSVDENRVSRYHVGWLYSNGMLFGHFTETETDMLSHDGNSYSGTNDTKMYDLNGTMFREVVGTAAATRIAP